MATLLVDNEMAAAFARDGVACVRGVLDPAELALRYLSAGARHAPRTWRTSPPFDGLEEELPAGSAMDHPLFPVVWPPSG
jgi:hypothetical protein